MGLCTHLRAEASDDLSLYRVCSSRWKARKQGCSDTGDA